MRIDLMLICHAFFCAVFFSVNIKLLERPFAKQRTWLETFFFLSPCLTKKKKDFSTYIKKKLLGYYFLTSHNEKTKSHRILYLII